MPYGRKYTRRRPRANYRKGGGYTRRNNTRYRGRYGRRRYNGRTRIYRTRNKLPTGVPDRMSLKLKYETIINMTSAGSTAVQVFRGNSLFDPDYTGVGTQPLGYDQWSNFYERYKVNASKMMISFSATSDSNIAATLLLNLTPNGGTSNTPDTRAYYEWGTTAYNRNKLVGLMSGGSPIVYMKNYVSTQKIWGEKTTSDEYSALITSNPARVWFWVFQVDAMSGGGAATTGLVKCTITYYCEFYDRKQLLSS